MLTPTRRRAKAFYRLGMLKSRRAVRALASSRTEHERRRIEAEVQEAGRISNAYLLLLTCACGIAALGLLQSSAAVVIGAMLISPLMGPIMAMGLALARFDPPSVRTAAGTLALGSAGAIAASALIVWLSPLKDVTPEILARTRPTLLDLIVAVLSGVVGAYVTITRRGAVIAGVAIATALMPPLAVVGYGLATWSAPVAGGAMLLFLTNVVAIVGAVYGMARLYGFRHVGKAEVGWQTPVLLAVMAALCVPLAVSLQSIVIETRETHRARSAIEAVFADAGGRVSELAVEVDRGRVSEVQAIVFARRYVSGAEAAVRARLGGAPQVDLEQILSAEEDAVAGGRSALLNRALTAPQAAPRSAEGRLRDMLSVAGRVSSIDRADGTLKAMVVLPDGADLGDYRALETAAQRFLPDQEVLITPPFLPLPQIRFARGSRALDEEARAQAADAAWALQRWGVPAVRVVGMASPGPRGPRRRDLALASARAEAVAQALAASGAPPARTSASVPDAAGPDEAMWWVARLEPEGQAPRP
ncbi:MAG: DUF389 domain-containing protein [Phenylobacterium sp.]|uniref:DUF389 domain-containing protein n=1 Tax=Phenylobacterium sp. TaxID=1871053 RepID=UPI00391D6F02